MIPVDQINEEVLQKRFDVLPKNLQDALSSDRLLDVITAVCTKYLLVDEAKQEVVQQIVSLVLLGIVHSYDVASELSEYLQIDPRLGTSIAADLDAKVFSSYKGDLDRNFSPIVTEEPKTAQEIAPTIAPKAPAQPVMFEDVQKIPASSQPVPAAPKATFPQTSQISIPKVDDQIPKPVILQENASFELNRGSSDFHVETSQDKMKGLSSIPRPAQVKPAVLELGVTPKAPQKTSAANSKYEGEFGSISSKSTSIPAKDRMISEITAPLKSSNEPVVPKAPAGISLPPKPPVVPAPAPMQIPMEKQPDQAKTMPAFFSSAPQPAKTSPIKPIVIQKNYSATDMPPKPPIPPQTPSSNTPIPPQKS